MPSQLKISKRNKTQTLNQFWLIIKFAQTTIKKWLQLKKTWPGSDVQMFNSEKNVLLFFVFDFWVSKIRKRMHLINIPPWHQELKYWGLRPAARWPQAIRSSTPRLRSTHRLAWSRRGRSSARCSSAPLPVCLCCTRPSVTGNKITQNAREAPRNLSAKCC